MSEVHPLHSLSFHLQPRCLRSRDDGLRSFQRETLGALDTGGKRILVVHAPVGAGKSHIVGELLKRQAGQAKRSQVILTFPTLALMNAQVESLRQREWISVIQADPQGRFPMGDPGKAALFAYGSDVIYRVLALQEQPERIDKAAFLESALDTVFWSSRAGAVVTTPDVLFLMLRGAYDRNLKAHAKGAVIFLDEFHLYHNLGNFKILLEKLLGYGARLVFMSATPYFSGDVQNFLKEYQEQIEEIHCVEETGDGAVPFNHALDAEVWNLRYTIKEASIQALLRILPACPKPAAVIFDSVFRLMQVTPSLERQLKERAPSLQFIQYHGITKDPLRLTSDTILWGTSSIEVGVDFKNLRTLVTESSYWPNAIQRLGRVGRHGPGKAYLLTAVRFDPVWKELGPTCSRTDFEQKGMMRVLRDPKHEVIHGNMFRGDSQTFVLLNLGADDESRRIVIYDESVFSMFDIQDFCENWRKLGGWNEKREVLRKYRFPEDRIREILLKDLVFPFRGLLVGKLRSWYRPIAVRNLGEDGVVIRAEGEPSIRFE